MTTIALARSGDWLVMACDGRMTEGCTIRSREFVKIRRLGNVLIGFAGSPADCERMIRWYAAGQKGRRPKIDGHLLMVTNEGKAYTSDDGALEIHSDIPTAIGSGAAHALTALDLGCTAQDAVRAAIKRDSASGGKVRSLRMKLVKASRSKA